MNRARGGMALVVTIGVLMLLSVMTIALSSLALSFQVRVVGRVGQATSRLMARSGSEYASARLAADSKSETATSIVDSADDWTYRNDLQIPLERSLNPSYAQTEPYQDIYPSGAAASGGTGKGKYDAGADPYTDLNANGRFDSCSGRLRGPQGASGVSFLLKVTGEGGKIDVNGGMLEAGDLNENGIPDHEDLGSGFYGLTRDDFNTVFSGKKVEFDFVSKRNWRIADILNRLAHVLGTSGVGSPFLPSDAADLPASVAGDGMIRKRPLGGYRSLEQLRRDLAPAEWELLRDHVSVRSATQGTMGILRNEAAYPTPNRLIPERRQRIRMDSAAPPVFQALSWNLDFYGLYARGQTATGLLQGLNVPATWSDSRSSVTREEARRVAEFLASQRPFMSWHDCYTRFASKENEIFAERLAPQLINEISLEPSFFTALLFGNAFPKLRNVRFFQNATPESYRRYGRPPSDDLAASFAMMNKHEGFWDPEFGAIYLGGVISRVPRSPGFFPYWSLEYDMTGPEQLFAVESLGRSQGSSCWNRILVAVGDSAAAWTQADFENLGGFSPPADLQILERPTKDRMQTYPQFPLESFPEKKGDPDYVYSPYAGSIRLMDRSSGVQGEELFYVPCWEVGQPLREPREAGSFADNFQDVVGKARWVPSHHHPASSTWGIAGERWGVVHPITASDILASGLCALGDGTGHLRCSQQCWTEYTPGSLYHGGVFRWGTGGGIEEEGPTWGRYGKVNEGDFPMSDAGRVERGTIEFWAATLKMKQLNPMHLLLEDGYWRQIHSVTSQMQEDPPEEGIPKSWAGGQAEEIAFLGIPEPPWTFLSLVFDVVEGVTIYLNGVPAGHGQYQAYATDPAWKQSLGLGNFCREASTYPRMDEIRFYPGPVSPAKITAQAQRSRFWTADSSDPPDPLAEVPSFVSPLYVFDQSARIRWSAYDGFVAPAVQEATSGWNREHLSGNEVQLPLKVELHLYAARDGKGTPRIVRFPNESYRSGGMRVALDEAGIGSFRYKIWMDVSTVDGFNNETPVFDSITVGYITKARVFEVAEQER